MPYEIRFFNTINVFADNSVCLNKMDIFCSINFIMDKLIEGLLQHMVFEVAQIQQVDG